jgi:hypothetical protein
VFLYFLAFSRLEYSLIEVHNNNRRCSRILLSPQTFNKKVSHARPRPSMLTRISRSRGRAILVMPLHRKFISRASQVFTT